MKGAKVVARCILVLSSAGVTASSLTEEQRPRILFLSKSSGYEHSSVARGRRAKSHVEGILDEIANHHGLAFVLTKSAERIEDAELANLDAVVFYTTGDLTQAGSGKGLFGGDGQPPMGPTGVADLIRWVEEGGALMGFHPAADTFHDPSGEPSPYIELLGGEFLTHGQMFPGKLKIVDPDHPTMAHIPQDWTVMDEWYVFKNMNVDRVHVLALLDTSSDPLNQPMYERPPYPVIWCASVGKGRVFYNAMGHREDVWDNPIFQQAFIDALNWALGRTPLDAGPNWKTVVPEAAPTAE
jgi:type 1 glutamine amidotransferase